MIPRRDACCEAVRQQAVGRRDAPVTVPRTVRVTAGTVPAHPFLCHSPLASPSPPSCIAAAAPRVSLTRSPPPSPLPSGMIFLK